MLVGCAGWAIPKVAVDAFPAEGSHLERYAARFPAVEINSSFYRPHRPSTWRRWGETVPPAFRFAAKLPKAITHEARLRDPEGALDAFLAEVSELGARLGCLLVQLPPSLAFDAEIAPRFLAVLRERHAGALAIEPRHPTWFEPDVAALLVAHRVARVAADPACVPEAALPGGWPGLVYHRLHGSPRIYYSSYEPERLGAQARRIERDLAAGRDVWCIFDNTTLNAACGNALDLRDRLRARILKLTASSG